MLPANLPPILKSRPPKREMLREDIKEEKVEIEKIDLKDSPSLKVKKDNKANKLNKEENQGNPDNQGNPENPGSPESPENKRKATKKPPRKTAEKEVTEMVNNDLFTHEYFKHHFRLILISEKISNIRHLTFVVLGNNINLLLERYSFLKLLRLHQSLLLDSFVVLLFQFLVIDVQTAFVYFLIVVFIDGQLLFIQNCLVVLFVYYL